MKFAIKVRDARIALGWSQTKLAVEVFGDKKYQPRVSEIETGHHVDPETAARLAVAMGADILTDYCARCVVQITRKAQFSNADEQVLLDALSRQLTVGLQLIQGDVDRDEDALRLYVDGLAAFVRYFQLKFPPE